MVKKIAAFILCTLLLVSFAVPVGAVSSSLNITADKTDVKPGDTVVLNVTLSGVEGLAVEGISFLLSMPEGLEIQSGNVLCSKSFALSNFNPESGLFSAVYNAKEETASEWKIVEVTCKVTEAASGKMKVRIPVENDFELFYIDSSKGNMDYYDIICAECSVTLTAPYNPNAAAENNNDGTEENDLQEASGAPEAEAPADNNKKSDNGTSAETEGEGKKEEENPSSGANGSGNSDNKRSEEQPDGTGNTLQPGTSAAADSPEEPAVPDETVPDLVSQISEDTAMSDGADDSAVFDKTAETEEPAGKNDEQKTTDRMLIIYACIGIVAVIAIAALVTVIVKKKKV